MKAQVKAKSKTKVVVKAKAKAKPVNKARTVKAKTVKAKPAKKVAAKTPAKKVTAKKPTAQKVAAKPVMTKPVGKSQLTKTIDYTKVMTPLGDRLVVRLISAERVTVGGLIIPDTVSTVEGHLKGEVLAAGTGLRSKKGHKRPLDVSVGDKIYFNQHSATKVTFGLEELHIVKEVDVLGVAQ